ncbi:Gfo/Idh/MocA family oxidoreductase [Sphaerisporangium sp. NPDC005289]|uniref:Gfo/Idh/MocA family protein n=1 Tax=Sphaerisporangium sp. NPDC005289 TaxID=3155247 RepID=UPI0033BCB951
MRVVRIGVLGASRVAPEALFGPARAVPGAEVAAVAARDPERARRYAARHGVPRVLPGYQALLDDPGVDAVYIALPNAAHAEWTLRALEAGKHVLCEKPLAANARQAAEVAAAARRTGLVVMEGMHYRHHPLAERMRVLAGEALGTVTRVETANCWPVPRFDGLIYDYALGGGATMIAGCYAIDCLRLVGSASLGEPSATGARALLRGPGADRAMTGECVFPGGATGRFRCSLWSAARPSMSVRVTGERGEMRVTGYLMPHLFHRITVRAGGRTWHERLRGEPTYHGQLRAFAAAVLDGAPVATDAANATATLRLIDAFYHHAGLHPRGLP